MADLITGAHPDATRERRLRALLANTSRDARIGAWELITATGEVYWSDVTREIHEVDVDFVPSLEDGVRFYKEGRDREAIERLVARATEHGEPWDTELRIVTARGNVRWVRAVGRVVRRDGHTERMYGSFQDIHEAKLRDLQLQERERFLGIMEASARIGGWEYDVVADRVIYTAGANALFGFDAGEEWTAERMLNYYVDGPEKEELIRLYGRCLAEGTPYTTDFRIRTADGRERWVRTNGRAGHNDAGEIVRVYGTLQDIDDDKRKDLRLAESEVLLSHNFDTAPSGMAIANADGRFRRVSRSFTEMLGYSEGELVAMDLRDVTHPDDLEGDLERLAQIASGAIDSFRREKRYVRKDGSTLFADVSVTAQRDPAGAPASYHVQLIDVTADKLEETRRLRVALLEEKAREMEQFAYIASHDLRQPVLTIQGYIDAFVEDFGDQLGEQAHHYLDVIQKASLRMDAMIKGLLDYSRLSQAKQLQEVDLTAVVGEVIEDLAALIESTGASVEADPLDTVLGYPIELRQLFQNLIANALTYHREGVRPVVRVTCAPTEGGHRFAVVDNGIGVPERDRERIFGLFQRSAQGHPAKGTGIGLANCRTIVERHGGSIGVRPVEGGGSEFYFTILTDLVSDDA